MKELEMGKQVKWKGRLLGYYIKGDRGVWFISPRVRSKHFFRMYKGYAINEEFLKHLNDIFCTQVRIIEQDTGKVLSAHPSLWLKEGIHHRSKGFEPQMVLPESKFKVG